MNIIIIYHNLSGKFAILNPYYYSRLLFSNPVYHETKSKKTIYEIVLKYALHLEKHYGEKKGNYGNLEYSPYFTRVTDYKKLMGIISHYYNYLKEYDKALEYNIKFTIRYFTDSTLYENKLMVYVMEKSIHKEIKKVYNKLNFESSKETYEIYIKAYESLKIPTHIKAEDGFKYWRQFLDTGELSDKLFEEIDQKYSYMLKIDDKI